MTVRKLTDVPALAKELDAHVPHGHQYPFAFLLVVTREPRDALRLLECVLLARSPENVPHRHADDIARLGVDALDWMADLVLLPPLMRTFCVKFPVDAIGVEESHYGLIFESRELDVVDPFDVFDESR